MKMYELFSRPGSWTQRALARDVNNIPCMPEDADAVCWCLVGGAVRCYPSYDDFYNILEKIRNKYFDPVSYNNNNRRTQDEIVELCKELNI